MTAEEGPISVGQEEDQSPAAAAEPPLPVQVAERAIEPVAKDETQNDAAKREDGAYLPDEALLKHVRRQGLIVADCLKDRLEVPTHPAELSLAYERELFSPTRPPRRQENGTCEPNPKLNFYPTFCVPEVLATYHIFFQNQKVPLSCRANRAGADAALELFEGARIPDYETMDTVPKIFEGLGDEVVSEHARERGEGDASALVELRDDNPRLAVVKRSLAVTHFAYPAIHLPPKVLTTVMDVLLTKRARPANTTDELDPEGGEQAVSDEELARWLGTRDPEAVQAQRKTMLGTVLVTALLECMKRFFTHKDMVKSVGEALHYTFRHGYVALATKISNVELSNVITYMGILHENRLGHSVLHRTIHGEARRDYIRDTVFLMLVHTWQTAMGVWQQCLEEENLKELVKLLERAKRGLWSQTVQRLQAQDLADIIFPPRLLQTLHASLPDIVSQSQMQNFRSFVLERSGILPAMSAALPTDFVPLSFKECPPTLWPYTYLLQLANYFMFHTDVCHDVSGEGLLESYCRCNLCTPHRCLATNTPLLNETQVIGTFDIRGPGGEDGGAAPTGLKLTAGMWTSAFLRKFEEADYHAHRIRFYENQSKPPKAEPSACVITQGSVLAQLQNIKKAREEFLLKKGQGVYLDPQTGDPLTEPSVDCRPRHPPQEQKELQNESTPRAIAAAPQPGGAGSGGRGAAQCRRHQRRGAPHGGPRKPARVGRPPRGGRGAGGSGHASA